MRKFILSLVLSAIPFASLSAQETLPSPKTEVLLTIKGKIDRTNGPRGAEFDRQMLEAIGMVKLETSTTFTEGRKIFEGIPLRAILTHVGAHGTLLKGIALNDYATSLPLEDLKYEPILAMRMDGVILTARDKGPLWIVFPKDRFPNELAGAVHDQKWIWQLDRLDVE